MGKHQPITHLLGVQYLAVLCNNNKIGLRSEYKRNDIQAAAFITSCKAINYFGSQDIVKCVQVISHRCEDILR